MEMGFSLANDIRTIKKLFMSVKASLLVLDTALSYVQVSLRTSSGHVRVYKNLQKDFVPVHSMIQLALESEQQIPSAVAVVAGPGSYTGLRIGMSTAKGLCYAWKVPLIPLDTLQLFAWQAMRTLAPIPADAIILSVLEARKEEVYFATFDHLGQRLSADATATLHVDWLKSLGQVAIVAGSTGGAIASVFSSLIPGTPLFQIECIQHDVCLSLADQRQKYFALEFMRTCSPNYVKDVYIKLKHGK